ncbi:MAG: hypothetical protein JWP69_2066 [Flaviaesturariibacter sp.]|nr:hypothetical protein [Flaviaesturariibacter sp.]
MTKSKGKVAFIMSFIYVLFGTAYALYYSKIGEPIPDVEPFAFDFFAPASFLLILLLSGQANHIGLSIVMQILVLIAFWLTLWLLITLLGKLIKALKKN